MITREMCKMCHHVSPIGFHVPDHIWRDVVPDWALDAVVCLGCFTALGDEKMIQWDEDIKFFPVSMYTHVFDGDKIGRVYSHEEVKREIVSEVGVQ